MNSAGKGKGGGRLGRSLTRKREAPQGVLEFGSWGRLTEHFTANSEREERGRGKEKGEPNPPGTQGTGGRTEN